ncbi:MAG: CsbD family protein [Hyellaceae cyanobacterium CSU_1_1]|jgi:uncharacterized protein YjbJ (UPF0337 family)|nr:CsbD family protein [Hyellaceae cyanobacterium CSU_1_1]
MNIKKDVENAAEKLKLKAEARSENIEGTIRENLGDYSDDQEAVEAGQEKQAQADELRAEAENK